VLHHIDLKVANLEVFSTFYSPLLSRLGYIRAGSGRGWEVWRGVGAYLTLVQADEPYLSAGYHRRRIGLNHLAFSAPTRGAVDEMHSWLVERHIRVLYGGPKEMGTVDAPNYAVYFEDPDRVKLEFVYPPARFGHDDIPVVGG
jgi:catechol 2,3-dioxygenase-like lactoylglutathione lyase family enzyme